MYNTKVLQGLADTVASEAWAILERLDGQGSYEFLVNPTKETWEHSAEFAKLPVANTNQPITRYKYSESTFSLPQVVFYSPDNSKQLKTLLDTLVSFTKPVKAGDDLPLLKLTYGDTLIERCYLAKLSITSEMKLGGNVSMAEGSMSFILAPELPKVELAPLAPTNSIKLSEKELTEASGLVLAAFEADPKLCEKYKVDVKTLQVGVTADKKVLLNGKDVGTLSEVLGSSLPPKWAEVSMM